MSSSECAQKRPKMAPEVATKAAWYVTVARVGEDVFEWADVKRFRVSNFPEDWIKQSASYTCFGIHTTGFKDEAHPQVAEFAADLINDGEGCTPSLRQATLLSDSDPIPFGSVHVSIHYFYHE